VLSRISTHLKLYHLQQQQRRYAEELAFQVDLKTAELRQRNQALHAANAGLEKALQVKNDFLMLMNHELRTPLNGVLGMAQLLRTDLAEDKREYLNILEDSGWHLLKLIDNLLRVSKEGAPLESLDGQIAPLDISAVCRESISMIAARAQEKNITVQMEINDVQCLEMPLDSARLHQILANLLDNAVKFTPANGHVGLCAYYSGTILFIEIWDSGPGIAEADRERIFDAFVQLEPIQTRLHEGLGLGLTLARNLVRVHGGGIDAFSHENGGSVFRVSLAAKVVSTTPAICHEVLGMPTETMLEKLPATQQQKLQNL
jgi:signal transduction histidine kinase